MTATLHSFFAGFISNRCYITSVENSRRSSQTKRKLNIVELPIALNDVDSLQNASGDGEKAIEISGEMVYIKSENNWEDTNCEMTENISLQRNGIFQEREFDGNGPNHLAFVPTDNAVHKRQESTTFTKISQKRKQHGLSSV